MQQNLLKNMIKLVDNFNAGHDYTTNEGSVFYFRTNLKAPNYHIICIDIWIIFLQVWMEKQNHI